MVIQWFPGHMNKALRMMEEEIKKVDVIIYVLDSRAPFSCVNPKFTKLIGDKPIIFALNKVDLANINVVKKWAEYFKGENRVSIMLNSTMSGGAKKVETAIKEVCQKKIEKYKQKNLNMILRALVIGVPNCGKSTLINNLCGKGKTVTGNMAGVTRGKQWVKLTSGIEICDTPGTLWPAFDNERVARNLAYLGSIKEEVIDIPELSIEFIKDICVIDKTILENRYNIEIEEYDEAIDILEKICQSRKYLLKKGELDYDRGAYAIIQEFKAGKMGGITLESVKDLEDLTRKTRRKAIEQENEEQE